MTYPKAILIGAALIAASILLTEAIPPADAQGQLGMSPKLAKCILQNMGNARVDRSATLLIQVCQSLNRAR